MVVLNPENYKKMKAMESSDDCPLFSEELNDFADNVQIVEFDDFVHDQRLLAHKTLAKIPTQVVNFFKGQGINPMPFLDDQRKTTLTRLADHDNVDNQR